jgi:hypothetical protein
MIFVEFLTLSLSLLNFGHDGGTITPVGYRTNRMQSQCTTKVWCMIIFGRKYNVNIIYYIKNRFY